MYVYDGLRIGRNEKARTILDIKKIFLMTKYIGADNVALLKV